MEEKSKVFQRAQGRLTGKTSQELRMLSSVTLNCQETKNVVKFTM